MLVFIFREEEQGEIYLSLKMQRASDSSSLERIGSKQDGANTLQDAAIGFNGLRTSLGSGSFS